jgi:hypothetical protein
MPLFKPDDLGNYFIPKLLYRGFEILYLDMSSVSMGKFELEAIQDCIRDPQCNNFLKEIGLKIYKTKATIQKAEVVASYKRILEVIDQHKTIEKIKLFFDVPTISPNIH